jgi:hypothetical protein
VLQNVDDTGKVKGSCEVQETQFLCGLTIERIVRIYGHVQKGCCPRGSMSSIHAEHQFPVIQTVFISPENADFTSVEKKHSSGRPRIRRNR